MRIVFMGTPDFAVGSLQALCESGKHEILAVVTQPDRPKGRGNKLLQTPVKEYALAQGLTVYQPQKVKTPEFVELLEQGNSGAAEIRLHQRTRFPAAEVSRCGTDSVRHHQGRKGIRRNDYADGYWHGYRRYAG